MATFESFIRVHVADPFNFALTPKLRAETHDARRAVLQNAVEATDHQIDALVYELYALTPEEITLVEGAAK